MLVSVIIPCYNSELYLKETLDSVLKQTYPDIEILCVDNNSTDGTVDLIKELQKSHANIKLLFEKTPGASFARNTGLSAAKGEFIQFLDSDDVITKDKFEKQVAYLVENELDWVVSDRIVKSADFTEILEKHSYSDILNHPLKTGITEVITSGNPLYTKAIVEKVGGYTRELKMGQDWDFHLKLILLKSRLGYLEGEFFQSRRLENSLSSNWLEVSKVVCKLILAYKNDFNANGVASNLKIYTKIFRQYYTTAIYTSNRKELNFYLNEMKYWSQVHKPSAVLTRKEKFVAQLIGIKGLIIVKRFFLKNKAD
jgi:glycosyltransferase involved in cell wall biosynthesis